MTKRTVSAEDVNRLAAGLADSGQLIEAGWLALRSLAIPHNASETQVNEMRRAFFCGAQHLFSSIVGILDADREPTARDMQRMQHIHEELEGFGKTLQAELDRL